MIVVKYKLYYPIPDLQGRHEVLVVPRPGLVAAADLHLPPALHLGLRHRGHGRDAQGSVEGGLDTRPSRGRVGGLGLEEGHLRDE